MFSTLAVLAMLACGSQAMNLVGARYGSPGYCPNITEKFDFDPVPYLGRWYEIDRYDIVFQSGMDCVNAIYSDMGDGYVEVHNTARLASGGFTDIFGQAHAIAPGVLLVEFAGYIPAEYHILDTDYENFSSVYNCIQEGEYHFQYAWTLSRTPVMDEAILEKAKNAFSVNGIDLELFHLTYQGDDCPYV